MIAIAPTDRDWFHQLRSELAVENVNFWTPTPWNVRSLAAGDRFYFLVKGRTPRLVGGYGHFVRYENLPIERAWEQYGRGNGVQDLAELRERIHKYASERSVMGGEGYPEIGCIILEEPVFFDDANFFNPDEYGAPFPRQVVKLKYFPNLHQIGPLPGTPFERGDFQLIAPRTRAKRRGLLPDRKGQQPFRQRLLSIYKTCAVTGEHSEPVLEAAHIQAYISEDSNHVQNGILLRVDLHRLFDEGLITIDRDNRLRVSRLVDSDTYRALDGRPVRLPNEKRWRPSAEALTHHRRDVFRDQR